VKPNKDSLERMKVRMYAADKNSYLRSSNASTFVSKLSFNSKIEMLNSEVDLMKTDKQIGRFLKKQMNHSLFI